VSGEYAIIKAAAERGWLDENRAIVETITAIKRAGADLIASYLRKTLSKLSANDNSAKRALFDGLSYPYRRCEFARKGIQKRGRYASVYQICEGAYLLTKTEIDHRLYQQLRSHDFRTCASRSLEALKKQVVHSLSFGARKAEVEMAELIKKMVPKLDWCEW
jgi:hypothetical protein